MLMACSHVLLASDDVPRITRFFERTFDLPPRFENDMFSEFVLPSRFRLAFFKPVGASARSFRAEASREGSALGLTVSDVDALFQKVTALGDPAIGVSGPPKELDDFLVAYRVKVFVKLAHGIEKTRRQQANHVVAPVSHFTQSIGRGNRHSDHE